MTFTGILGALLGLLAFPFAIVDRTRARVAIFMFAYVMHIGAAIAYYIYSLSNVTDAAGYYTDEFGFGASHQFGFGTQFVHFTVQLLKDTIGGTMLDFFLVFQTLGFLGICMLMRIIEEIYGSLDVRQPPYAYLLLFLPGLHFWTSAIGKDGALFCAVCLALWASIDLRRRVIPFAGAIVLMLLFRPHIAILAAAAVAVTMLFERGMGVVARSVLLIGALVGLGVATSIVNSSMAVDVTSADAVSNFLANHEAITNDAEIAGNSAVQGNYAVRLFSLLFRPLFVDAQGLFGLIASFENAILVALIFKLVANSRDVWTLIKRVAFARFAAVLALGIIFLLSLVYYNIGLGLRQKTMFQPALIMLLVALLAVRSARTAAATAAGRQEAPHGMLIDAPSPALASTSELRR